MSRKSNKRLYFALLLTVALAIAGCDRKTIYHHYEHTPLTGWEKEDTLTFTVTPMEQTTVTRRDVELRMADSYPFQNLSFIVEQTTLPSCLVRRDTIKSQVRTPDGNMTGQGVALYQYKFHLPDVSLDEGDSLCLRIFHNMKSMTLPGIADVGIRLTVY